MKSTKHLGKSRKRIAGRTQKDDSALYFSKRITSVANTTLFLLNKWIEPGSRALESLQKLQAQLLKTGWRERCPLLFRNGQVLMAGRHGLPCVSSGWEPGRPSGMPGNAARPLQLRNRGKGTHAGHLWVGQQHGQWSPGFLMHLLL